MKLKLTMGILSLLLVACAVFAGCAIPSAPNSNIEAGYNAIGNDDGAVSKAPDSEQTTDAQTTKAPETTKPPETTAKPETTTPETTVPVTTAPETTAPVTTQPPVQADTDYVPTKPVDSSTFDNALFIGDSRTVGISACGDLGNADVFATTGLNVFRVFNETVSVNSCGATKLEPLLQNKSYSKIYIMLGINEVGYNIDVLKNKFTELFSKVRVYQPEAVIYMCANLHITHERSAVDSVYNNEKLNAINDFFASLCDGDKTRYIDVNTIFDDENHGLSKAYASDDFHLIGKYYIQWSEWLANVS